MVCLSHVNSLPLSNIHIHAKPHNELSYIIESQQAWTLMSTSLHRAAVAQPFFIHSARVGTVVTVAQRRQVAAHKRFTSDYGTLSLCHGNFRDVGRIERVI
jgi:hypothetical protein